MKPGAYPIIFGLLIVLWGLAVALPAAWIVPCTGHINCSSGPNEPYYTLGLIIVAAGIVVTATGLVMRERTRIYPDQTEVSASAP